MIKIYFTENKKEWNSEQLIGMMRHLPAKMQTKISVYKGWRGRQSRISGKWLLLRLLEEFELNYTLADLKYTEFNKPHFASLHSYPLGREAECKVDFSTAHSGEIVVCAASPGAEIGIDIEQMVPVELSDYKEHLTGNEWRQISRSANVTKAFYEIWTKKEALLKATGRGVDIDFDVLDVCGDTVTYDGRDYWFYPISTADGYIAYIATSAPADSGSISSERLSGPL